MDSKLRTHNDPTGTLYLVSTPIGNFNDLSFRAVQILRYVQFIAAENAQVTRELLNHYTIETSVTTYHQLNKEEKTPVILNRLQGGHHVALVCDAGTPVIADPGAFLISEALAAGIAVSPVPGASAVIAALSVSGLSCDQFVFLGLFPQQSSARRTLVAALADETRTAVLFVSVKDLGPALDLFHPVLGERKIVAAGNMTTTNETLFRGRVPELRQTFSNSPLEGEVTVVIEGNKRTRSKRTGVRPG
jgi:16S rRNA (cytidine1402-2'-O)-methyltransferase